MKFHLTEIIDIEQLKQLCESFTNLNGMATAILDLEGNVHVATGWQSVCTMFHRINNETKKRCTESDTILAGQIKQGHKYNIYKCKNGLIDVAMPIIVGNIHIGNFFTGQFLIEKPDLNFFKKQANEYNFDENEYLSALEKTPILSEEQIKVTIEFLVKLTEVIGNIGLKNLQNIEYARQIKLEKDKVEKSEQLKAELIAKYNESQKIALIGSWDWNMITNEVWWSDETYSIFEVNPEEFQPDVNSNTAFLIPNEIPAYFKVFNNCIRSGKLLNHDFRIRTPRGIIKQCNAQGKVLRNKNDEPVRFIGTIMDITSRKKIEDALTITNFELIKAKEDAEKNECNLHLKNEEYKIINKKLLQANNELLKAYERIEESESRLRNYFQLGLLGMAITSVDKKWVEVNDVICNFLGYSKEEILQKTWAELTHPDDIEIDFANFDKVIKGEIEGYKINKRFIKKNGDVIYTELSVRCIRDSNRKAKYFLALIHDITELKYALRPSE